MSSNLIKKYGLAAALLVGFSVINGAPTAMAQTVRQPTLEERLTFGLQVRLPSEQAFIDAVVAAVQQGVVPQSLVDSTFFWARRRTPIKGGRFTRRPIIYFQPALEIQLDRLNINIATPRLSFFSRAT